MNRLKIDDLVILLKFESKMFLEKVRNLSLKRRPNSFKIEWVGLIEAGIYILENSNLNEL